MKWHKHLKAKLESRFGTDAKNDMRNALSIFSTDRNSPRTVKNVNGKLVNADEKREHRLRSAESTYRAASDKYAQTKQGSKEKRKDEKKRAKEAKSNRLKAKFFGYKPTVITRSYKPKSTPSKDSFSSTKQTSKPSAAEAARKQGYTHAADKIEKENKRRNNYNASPDYVKRQIDREKSNAKKNKKKYKKKYKKLSSWRNNF